MSATARTAAKKIVLDALNDNAVRRGDYTRQDSAADAVVNALDAAGHYFPEPEASSDE